MFYGKHKNTRILYSLVLHNHTWERGLYIHTLVSSSLLNKDMKYEVSNLRSEGPIVLYISD